LTSEDNIEVIRTAVDAWNRGDWDGALDRAAPNIELDNSSNRADWRGVHRGRDEVKRLWQTFTEPWESVRIEIEEFIPTPTADVVTRQTVYFLGRDGIEVTARTNWAWQFEDGELVRLFAFNELDDALMAVGLSE
jgi:ketosteroid isomerase-like protein